MLFRGCSAAPKETPGEALSPGVAAVSPEERGPLSLPVRGGAGEAARRLRIFLAEKNWEGCGGLRMTDEIKVTIAAQACLLLLGMERRLLRPGAVDPGLPARLRRRRRRTRSGRAAWSRRGERPAGRGLTAGRSSSPGTTCWPGPSHPTTATTSSSTSSPTSSTCSTAPLDGTPPLRDRSSAAPLARVMSGRVPAARPRLRARPATLLDEYGATNPAEFFAVATECFFEKPAQMARRHPQLYVLLREYYRQDPAARCAQNPGCHAPGDPS